MSTTEQLIAGGSGQTKVTAAHLQQLAYIYVRQSSPKQVLHNQESQLYQRQLTQRAGTLGWPPARIRVIDTDLAQSGKESASRRGFQELVAAVSLGQVGIVFGYEVSRLARNNSDWYHLLDLAAVFNTLIADNDGVYNPRLYNDRLLLGLKGTMSEAELHLLQQRLAAGRLSQVKRGVYQQRLPTGLVRLADGQVVQDPDDQVRHVIELVFAKFHELGSARQVVYYCRRENIRLPRRQSRGPHAGQVVWKLPSDAAIREMLCNPAYAGAFAYGRRQMDPVRHQPNQPNSGRLARTMDDWVHLQPQVYPAYIPWAQFLANQEQLRQNVANFAPGPASRPGAVRAGDALLQGLVVCGFCGCHMHVLHKHTLRYACSILRGRGEPACQWVRAPGVDEVVVQAFFEALRPAQLDTLETTLAAQQVERARLEQHWAEQLKRAQYDAHLAGRQYQAVDPENRLVAAELERRWETKLQELQQVQVAQTQFQQQQPKRFELSPERRRQFQALSDTLPELWPELSNRQKKDLVRALIAQVILRRVQPDQVEIRIVWVSGHYTDRAAQLPILRQEHTTDHARLVQRIQEVWQANLSDEAAAAQLTAEGFHSARRTQITPFTVAKIRREHGWKLPWTQHRRAVEVEGQLTLNGLAARLGTTRQWLYHRIESEIIAPEFISRHPASNVILVRNDPELLKFLRRRLAEAKLS